MRVTFDEAKRPAYTRAVEATVQVTRRFYDENDNRMTGTGFIISEDGVIVTAYHVVGRARTVNVRLLSLSGKGWRIYAGGNRIADVMYRDPCADIALLRLRKPPTELCVASLGNSDEVSAIGTPLSRVGCDDDSRRIAEGYVFAKTRFDFNKKLPRIDVSMTAQQGGSGGPVFDMNGRVVGVAIHFAATPGHPQWVGFLPINVIRQRLAWRREIKELLPDGWPQ